MRRIIFAIVAAVGMSFMIGCKTESIQVIDTNGKKAQVGAFNDETYVWESFIFTTNRIEKVK